MFEILLLLQNPLLMFIMLALMMLLLALTAPLAAGLGGPAVWLGLAPDFLLMEESLGVHWSPGGLM